MADLTDDDLSRIWSALPDQPRDGWPSMASDHDFARAAITADRALNAAPVQVAAEPQGAIGKILSEDEMGVGFDREMGNVLWWAKPAGPALLYAAPPPQAAPVAPAACPGADPLCPCQDGAACHYRDAADGTKAWPVAPAALLVRDIANDMGVEPLRVCKALGALGYGPHSVNMAITGGMVRALSSHFAAAPSPLPAQVERAGWQWVPMHERAPEPDTECAVFLRFTLDRPPFVATDRWQMYREDPTGMGGPTLEMGYAWRDNYEGDVIAWLALPPSPPAEWDQRLPDDAVQPVAEPAEQPKG